MRALAHWATGVQSADTADTLEAMFTTARPVLLLLALNATATAFTVKTPSSRWTAVGGSRRGERLRASEYFTEDDESFPSDSGDPPIDDTSGTYAVDPLLKSDLLTVVAGLNRGFNAREDERSLVVALAEQLEASQGG